MHEIAGTEPSVEPFEDMFEFSGFGVVAEIDIDPKKRWVSIYSFSSHEQGRGNGRSAVAWLKKRFKHVVVNDPGLPDTNPGSFSFWKKMCDEGLISDMFDENGVLIYQSGKWRIPEGDADRYLPGFPDGLPSQ